jgi:hypothetical protein
MGFGDTWGRGLLANKEVGGLVDCCVLQVGAALA